MRHLLIASLAAAGCGSVAVGDGPRVFTADLPGATAEPPAEAVVFRGAGGGDVAFDPGSGRIVEDPGGGSVIDVSGRWIVPAFIDSHVHLAYYPVADDLLRAGVVGAVDLAAPERFVAAPARTGGRVVWAGPMVTPLEGYPTRSWGAGGYGAECADRAECEGVVERLVGAGAGVIKVPVGQGPDHHASVLEGIVERAHALQRPVAAHALSDQGAARAAASGVDALAHTPTGGLSEDTVAAWSGRAVISTLSAFGGRATTVGNLRRLRAGGAMVLYGTDLGNTRTVGVDPEEVRLLGEAGLDGAAIVEAGTRAPAQFWGLTDLGTLEPGKSASLLVLDADPAADPSVLARPEQVWIDGVRQR